jgi:hypothetical protein
MPKIVPMITIPEHCPLCGKLTRYGPLVDYEDTLEFVCSECVNWCEDNEVDVTELLREHFS